MSTSIILYQEGDIFTSDAQVITNPVNTYGVMGKGLAAAFKKRYPQMFPVYQQECKRGRLHAGRPTLYRESSPWILNFPTKEDPGKPSSLELIEAGLKYLVDNYDLVGMASLA